MIIIDIDDTIADAKWRRDMPYEEGMRQSANDRPIASMHHFLTCYIGGIVCLTARNERWRTLTNIWLLTNNFNFQELIMRPNDNYDQAPDYKLDAIRARMQKIHLTTLVCIDSREDVVAAYRAVGLTAMQSA